MSPINTIDFRDLDTKDLTPDWILDGWLEKGDLAILSGEQYSGKSWVATYLAFGIIKGESWVSKMKTPKTRRILYIDEDNKRAAIERRLKYFPQRIGRQPSEWADDFHYWYGNGMSLGKSKHGSIGGKRINPELIIIDSLFSFAHIELNRLEEVTKARAEFRAMQAVNDDCAILILHHNRKWPAGQTKGRKGTQDVAGSYGLTAMADTLWMLRQEGDEHIITNEKLRADPEAGKRNNEVRLTIKDHVVRCIS